MEVFKYLFRIVHIDNIPGILAYGIVRAGSPYADPDYVPIGEQSLIECRRDLFVPGTDKPLGSLIPFYFGPKQPMLYSIQHGYSGTIRRQIDEIAYCVVRIQTVIDRGLPGFFTDGHARSVATKFYPLTRLPEIDKILSIEDVSREQRGTDVDSTGELRRRKQAELLLDGEIDPGGIAGFVVGTQKAEEKIRSYGADVRVVVRPSYYF